MSFYEGLHAELTKSARPSLAKRLLYALIDLFDRALRLVKR